MTYYERHIGPETPSHCILGPLDHLYIIYLRVGTLIIVRLDRSDRIFIL